MRVVSILRRFREDSGLWLWSYAGLLGTEWEADAWNTAAVEIEREGGDEIMDVRTDHPSDPVDGQQWVRSDFDPMVIYMYLEGFYYSRPLQLDSGIEGRVDSNLDRIETLGRVALFPWRELGTEGDVPFEQQSADLSTASGKAFAEGWSGPAHWWDFDLSYYYQVTVDCDFPAVITVFSSTGKVLKQLSGEPYLLRYTFGYQETYTDAIIEVAPQDPDEASTGYTIVKYT